MRPAARSCSPDPLAAQEASSTQPIADNSFLIEEAYNQEAGVVQHISTFSRPDGGGSLGLLLHPGMALPRRACTSSATRFPS